MSNIRVPYYMLAIVLGIAAFIGGGYDDSPGLQLIGVVIILFSVCGIYLRRKKVPDPAAQSMAESPSRGE